MLRPWNAFWSLVLVELLKVVPMLETKYEMLFQTKLNHDAFTHHGAQSGPLQLFSGQKIL